MAKRRQKFIRHDRRIEVEQRRGERGRRRAQEATMRRFGADVDAPGKEQSMKHPVGDGLAVDQDAVAVEDDQGRRRRSRAPAVCHRRDFALEQVRRARAAVPRDAGLGMT